MFGEVSLPLEIFIMLFEIHIPHEANKIDDANDDVENDDRASTFVAQPGRNAHAVGVFPGLAAPRDNWERLSPALRRW